MTDYRLVLSTASTKEEAHKIARGLVDGGLAACVNIIPQVESVYRWRGKVEQAEEFLLLIKTMSSRLEQVYATIRGLHSYDIPEAITLPIDDGLPAYLGWVGESVS